jgi:cytochrome c553
MTYIKKTITSEQRKSLKKEKRKKPLQNSITIRLSDREIKQLEKHSHSTARSLSDILREALDSWKFKRNRLCLEE